MAAKKSTKKKTAKKKTTKKKTTKKKAARKVAAKATTTRRAAKKKAAKKASKKAAKKATKSRATKRKPASGSRYARVYAMSFASVYPHYVDKAIKKGRKKKDVDEIICWLTGYTPAALRSQIQRKNDFETFFGQAPKLHPNAVKITGVVCGVRVEEVDEPLMRHIRYLDKLVDELAKGRPMEKILRP